MQGEAGEFQCLFIAGLYSCNPYCPLALWVVFAIYETTSEAPWSSHHGCKIRVRIQLLERRRLEPHRSNTPLVHLVETRECRCSTKGYSFNRKDFCLERPTMYSVSANPELHGRCTVAHSMCNTVDMAHSFSLVLLR